MCAAMPAELQVWAGSGVDIKRRKKGGGVRGEGQLPHVNKQGFISRIVESLNESTNLNTLIGFIIHR